MDHSYDVVIVGGGIQGAGVAQATAAAGFSTLLIEKTTWAAGTSSKSSKLIHGGLRYLESGQIQLVWQSLRERKILLRIAPDLVKPLKFLIPIYRNTQRRPWQLFLGLSAYSLLAGLTKLSLFKRLSANTITTKIPLKKDGLQCFFSYYDAQTNDSLLTQAVVQSAANLGATTLANTELRQATKTQDGYQLKLLSNSKNGTSPTSIHCKILVNATGPWINAVAKRVDPVPAQLPVELVKGSHIVIRGSICDFGFYLESPSDQRAVFVLPWSGNTLIGTTEQRFCGDPGEVTASNQEIEYLTTCVQHYFPDIRIDIIDQFAGLRVLPGGSGSLFSRSRDGIIYNDKNHPRLMSLYGGKLTGYRHMGGQVLKKITQQLGARKPALDTATLTLKMPRNSR